MSVSVPAEQTNRVALVMFTPLPPQRNGIADYAFGLLQELRNGYQITVVVNDGARPDPIPGLNGVLTVFEYDQRADLHRHLHIYQLGNNADHVYMLPYLAQRPGLVVLHDPSLHHLLDCATIADGNLRGYEDALEAEFGSPGRTLAQQFTQLGIRDHAIFSALPAIKGIVGPARGVLVHSEHAGAKIGWQAPGVPVTVVPHYATKPQLGPSARDDVRKQLGISTDTILLMSVGFITRSKQIDLVLRALAAGKDQLRPFVYVVAGQADPDEADMEALARQLGIADKVRFTGYVAPDLLDVYVAASDILMNLRYPDFGETSGTLARALAVGACAIAIDSGAASEIPGGCLVKLPWQENTQALLTAKLVELTTNRGKRAKIGMRAAAWSIHARSLGKAVAGYRAAITTAMAEAPRHLTVRTIGWEMLPRSELTRLSPAWIDEASDIPLSLRTGLMPLPVGECSISIWAGSESDIRLFTDFLDRPVSCAVIVSEGVASPVHLRCDLLIISASTTEIPQQSESLLRAASCALRLGGVLVGNIFREASHPESDILRRADLTRRLEDVGFRLEDAATTAPATAAMIPVQLDSVRERMSFRAIKITEFQRKECPALMRVLAST